MRLKYTDDARQRVFVAGVLKFGKTQKLCLHKDGAASWGALRSTHDFSTGHSDKTKYWRHSSSGTKQCQQFPRVWESLSSTISVCVIPPGWPQSAQHRRRKEETEQSSSPVPKETAWYLKEQPCAQRSSSSPVPKAAALGLLPLSGTAREAAVFYNTLKTRTPKPKRGKPWAASPGDAAVTLGCGRHLIFQI